MTSDSNWPYIVAAYAICFAVIGGLALSILLEHRRLRRELAELGRDAAASERGEER